MMCANVISPIILRIEGANPHPLYCLAARSTTFGSMGVIASQGLAVGLAVCQVPMSRLRTLETAAIRTCFDR